MSGGFETKKHVLDSMHVTNSDAEKDIKQDNTTRHKSDLNLCHPTSQVRRSSTKLPAQLQLVEFNHPYQWTKVRQRSKCLNQACTSGVGGGGYSELLHTSTHSEHEAHQVDVVGCVKRVLYREAIPGRLWLMASRKAQWVVHTHH